MLQETFFVLTRAPEASDKTMTRADCLLHQQTGGLATRSSRKALSHRLTSFDHRLLLRQTSLLLPYCFSRRSQGQVVVENVTSTYVF